MTAEEERAQLKKELAAERAKAARLEGELARERAENASLRQMLEEVLRRLSEVEGQLVIAKLRSLEICHVKSARGG
jgi:septal ring factor EnvC (AmiA/AmiB activator)